MKLQDFFMICLSVYAYYLYDVFSYIVWLCVAVYFVCRFLQERKKKNGK